MTEGGTVTTSDRFSYDVSTTEESEVRARRAWSQVIARADRAEARVTELEAELAQSQAEVKLRGEYAHDLFRELRVESRLLTEARDLLFHDDLHGKSDKPCPGCALEARIDAARSPQPGEGEVSG